MHFSSTCWGRGLCNPTEMCQDRMCYISRHSGMQLRRWILTSSPKVPRFLDTLGCVRGLIPSLQEPGAFKFPNTLGSVWVLNFDSSNRKCSSFPTLSDVFGARGLTPKSGKGGFPVRRCAGRVCSERRLLKVPDLEVCPVLALDFRV
ncbi:hypothetical protein CSUI_009278 [Cystoisospora suis]|uniref:Uncharacterized protein n=1 Tax=Cystoisospora suis TaxID=483139 RepID=A0A2C6KKF6_9APIC|nr:hypothetical protein CSUI_009278 [Cystoisospora suis]